MVHGGDHFEALFAAHYGDLLAYAVRRCATRQDAEDVVAETFAVAWRRLDELPVGDQTRLWLFGTARLVWRNLERTRSRQRRLAERLQRLRSPLALQRGPDRDGTADDQLQRAIAALSETDREVLQLHAWEELTADEIAATLGISTSAAWKRLQRARDRLSGALAVDHGRNPDHGRGASAPADAEPVRKAAR
jgi:RNA polymerase sigma factor (sigma-70 family)